MGRHGQTILGGSPQLTDAGLLDGGAGPPVPEVMELAALAVPALGVVPAVVTHPSLRPLAGAEHGWVEVTGLRVAVAVTL